MNDACIDRLDAPAPQPDPEHGLDEEPVVDEAKAAHFRRQMNRAAGMTVVDAAKTKLAAQRKRLAAEHLAQQGDRIGSRFTLAEAAELETVADLALDPAVHSTGRVMVGAGGEAVLGSKSQFANTVRERPDMIAVTASEQRMELASAAGALELALDTAQTIGAQNGLERALAHQLSAAHVAAMELQAEARDLLQHYKRTGCIHQQLSIEAGRMMNAAARMMGTFQNGLLTLARLRSGGQQVIVVRQQIAVGEGGAAVIAGSVGSREKSGRAGGGTEQK
jgi:hypothetical protein